MYVLGHNDVTGNREEVAPAHALQRVFKEPHGRDCGKVRTTAITTEGEEMKLPGLLVTDACAFHALREYSNDDSVGGDE
jgi:hypothetical protein